jgi:serine/threonine protein kinase
VDDDVEYAGRLLAGRYRLPLSAEDVPEQAGARAYDTASGQEVLARRVLLPEVVDAEFVEDGEAGVPTGSGADGGSGRATRRPADPAARRAVDAALAASRIPDHPRLDQVYDVFVDGDTLWIVSELLPAQPLSELLAQCTLPAHRAAEIAADVLAALRTVHAHGWVHRNITARTVVVCEDGRAMLTGLAAGAAQEALCGHDPFPGPWGPRPGPQSSGEAPGDLARPGTPRAAGTARGAAPPATEPGPPPGGSARSASAPSSLPGAADGPLALPAGYHRGEGDDAGRNGIFGFEGADSGGGAAARAARRGAIAAYRAGTQAGSARVAAEASGRNDGWWAADGGRTADAVAEDADAGETDPPQVVVPDVPEAGVPEPYGPQGRPYGPPEPDPYGPTALPGPRETTRWAVPTPWAEDVMPSGAAPSAASPPVEAADADGRYRGPTTSLAAERARQARMTIVGAVIERWAPEQSGPVYEHWRLAPPVGASADLWALGVLLFRAVQGHGPYPEEDVAELVQAVCAEPPAFAEECGPLRPVVESLLRQDPTERPEPEVLRGWLRSLIRSAPEPDVGRHTLTAPSLEPGRPADPRRLPIVRRRGELVRRRRDGRDARPAPHTHREPAPPPREPRRRSTRGLGSRGGPAGLGRLLLGGVLLLLTAAVLYAMWFMPQKNQADDGSRRSSVGQPEASAEPAPEPDGAQPTRDAPTADDRPPAETQPQTSDPAAPAEGFRLHEDRTGFRIAVPKGWDRSGPNGRGQVRFEEGDFRMVVVKGRDTVKEFGADPMAYQSDSEPELDPFRASGWSTASGLRRIDVGDTAMAEGTYTWEDSGGRDVYVRNRAVILDGRYHLILVIGPDDERDTVDRWFEGAVDTYRVLSR